PTTTHRPPRGPRETTLLTLFTDILGTPHLGIDDNFFANGGHSILATRLISRIRTTLGATLTIRDLFAAPTVAELIERLDGGGEKNAFDVLLPLRPTGSLPPLFCVHPVGGVSWCYSSLLRHLPGDRPLYGLQSSAIERAGSVTELAERYLEEIRRIQPEGPYHLLGWSFGGLVAHAAAELLGQDQVAMLALLDSYPAFSGAERPGIEDPAEARQLLMDSVGYAAELDEELMASMTETVLHNSALMDAHKPGTIGGDALLFVASRTWEPELSPAGIWQPHVGGRLHVHEIDCAHDEMTRADAMAEIGPIVAQHLLEA
ncbi:thioesterase domain-containing protein, partial [Acrocarpospora catenulata]|uniref:thioesterase domain-containing protein n=1 Tax=Acrocarpospora catenulata TaxID=2836182 RepID=UPI002023AB35